MRISDWSSDVCSSDLVHAVAELALEQPELVGDACARRAGVVVAREEVPGPALVATEQPVHDTLRTRQPTARRSEEHTSELQSLMRISYAVFCLKKKRINQKLKNVNRAQKHKT